MLQAPSVWGQRVMHLLGLATLICYIVLLGCIHRTFPGVLRVRKVLSSRAARFWSYWRIKEEKDPYKCLVRQTCQAKRLRMIKKCSHIVHVPVAGVLFEVIQSSVDGLWADNWQSSGGQVRDWSFLHSIWVILVCLRFQVVDVSAPLSRFIDLVCVAEVLVIVAEIFLVSHELLLWVFTEMLIRQLFLILLFRRPAFAVLGNSIIFVSWVYVERVSDHRDDGDSSHAVGGPTKETFLLISFLVAGFLIAMSFLLKTLIEEEVLTAFAAWSARSSESTIQALLSAMCDAVVHLDPDLKIREHAPKLASLLVRSSCNGSLKGRTITSLMRDEDADRFRRHLRLSGETQQEMGYSISEASSNQPPGIANSLQVTFKDSQAFDVTVQVFTTSFVNICGVLGHMAVICQLSEGENLRGSTGSGSADTFGFISGPLHPFRPVRTERRLHTISLDSGFSAVPGGLELPMANPHAELPKVSVTFDAFADAFRIISCSASFNFLSGLAIEGLNLLDWMTQKSDFSMWVQEQVNAWLNESTDIGLGNEKFGIFDMLTPLSLRNMSEIRATWVLVPVPDSTENNASFPVTALLTQLQGRPLETTRLRQRGVQNFRL
mmetsp:Transcript_10549/g.23749  ORF Transcript_10549/g.23749 Transcript_10549/m.23749 type:complete len:605 (+) Transcript_10549:74-1888(+)